MNFSVDLNAPIFENSNFYKKKNLNLSVSMKNIEIDKENDNKKYKRILPTFTIPNRDPLLDKIKIQEEKEVKRLEKKFNVFRKEIKKKGGDTTEKFFKSISKNILQNNKIHIRNMKGLINDNNKSNNKSNLFLTGEQNPNYYFNPFNNLNQELLNSIENKKNDNIIDDLGFNNGREIISDRGYKIRSKRSDINFVDPNIDKNYHDIIRIESAVKKILASPNY